MIPLVLLLLGVGLLLATENVAVSSVIPAIYAGLASGRTALWIFRSDPYRTRARIAGAFSMAAAFWQAAAAAFVTVLTYVAVASATGREPAMEHFEATMLCLLGTLIATSILGLAASLAAAVCGIRVWVHPRLQALLKDPLRSMTCFNYAVFVLATSLGFPTVVACGILCIDPPSEGFMLAVMGLGPLAALTAYVWLQGRIIARNPIECWMPAQFDSPSRKW